MNDFFIPKSDVLKYQAGIFKTMAHETRLAILHILNDGEKSVNDIVLELDNKERTGVSKHLNILRLNNLIGVRGEGTKRIYFLKAQCILDAADCTLDLAEKNCCN